VDTEPDTNPEDVEEGEVVDGLPVLPGDAPAPEPVRSAGPPVAAKQAAALAATGFVAGAATVAVVSRHRTKRAAKKRKSSPFGEIMSSSSFLIDVHLLRRD
jgi:hypothetical protein